MKYLLIVLLSIFSAKAHSHRMNSAGLHGGNITMPGNYHVELVNRNNKIIVYLLDINFKNPQTKDSTVEIKVDNDSTKSCKSLKNSFDCGIVLKSNSKITIFSKRLNVKGTSSIYKLPLKY